MKISIGFLRGFFRRDSTTTLPPRVPGNPSMNFPSQGKNLLFRIGRFAYQPRAFTFPLSRDEIQRRFSQTWRSWDGAIVVAFIVAFIALRVRDDRGIDGNKRKFRHTYLSALPETQERKKRKRKKKKYRKTKT